MERSILVIAAKSGRGNSLQRNSGKANGKNCTGVKAIKLNHDNDYVDWHWYVHPRKKMHPWLVVSEKRSGKRSI